MIKVTKPTKEQLAENAKKMKGKKGSNGFKPLSKLFDKKSSKKSE